MFQIIYYPRAREDLFGLPTHIQDKIQEALEAKLPHYPELFGVKLHGILRDFWKLRVGDYRIGYIVIGKTVTIVGIGNRKDFYKMLERRLG